MRVTDEELLKRAEQAEAHLRQAWELLDRFSRADDFEDLLADVSISSVEFWQVHSKTIRLLTEGR